MRLARPSFDRRRFVLGVAGAAGLAACAVRPGERADVLIVGAGLAGLAAALKLEAAGQRVVIIDSENQVGGRVRTLRGELDGDVWVDVGAQGGSTSYARFVALCERYGLELTSSPPPAGGRDTLLQLKGGTYRKSELTVAPDNWPLDLAAPERAQAPSRLAASVLMPIAREVGRTERILDPAFAHYDQLSLADLLRQSGMSADALRLVAHTANYNALETVSSLNAIRDVTRFLTPGKSVFVEGGNDRLPRAMAADLRSRVRLGHTLVGLEQRAGDVAARVATPAGDDVIVAERVILTLPFTALRRVRITPQLPPLRRRMIDELPYTQVAKTFVQTSRSFLNTPPRIASVYSDTPFERVFNLSYGAPDEPGLLLNWINGEGLRAMRRASRAALPGEHRRRVVRWMRELWPEHADALGRSLSFDWHDTYARGAYAHFAPGQLTRFAPLIATPAGRRHFAGEHTELVAPGMEGALTSGERAASEVLARGPVARAG